MECGQGIPSYDVSLYYPWLLAVLDGWLDVGTRPGKSLA